MRVSLAAPWLVADLGRPMRVLSWSLNRPGFVTARRIVWREVRNADLPRDLDAGAWFAMELARAGFSDAVGLLTSRSVARHVAATVTVEGVTADCLATVGLSNAERVGTRVAAVEAAGTVNVALALSPGLTEGALVEALSVAAEARTAAVMEHGPLLPAGRATGTGTDCIAVAAPAGEAQHAGLHTAPGEAAGRAVLEAVGRGVRDWMAEFGSG